MPDETRVPFAQQIADAEWAEDMARVRLDVAAVYEKNGRPDAPECTINRTFGERFARLAASSRSVVALNVRLAKKSALLAAWALERAALVELWDDAAKERDAALAKVADLEELTWDTITMGEALRDRARFFTLVRYWDRIVEGDFDERRHWMFGTTDDLETLSEPYYTLTECVDAMVTELGAAGPG